MKKVLILLAFAMLYNLIHAGNINENGTQKGILLDSCILEAYRNSGTTYDWRNKNIYSYDSTGILDTIVYFNWVGTEWRYTSKTIMGYDEENKLISQTVFDWDILSNDWELRYVSNLEYDEFGRVILEEAPGNLRYEYEYDEEGHLLTKTFYNWESSWVLWSQEAYTYTPNRIRMLWSHINISTDIFEKLYEQIDTLNNSGKILSRYINSWDRDLEEFVTSTKYSYVRNGSDQLTEYYFLIWSDSQNEYINNEKKTYEYDEKGNLIYETNLSWESYDSSWKLNYEDDYYLDLDFELSNCKYFVNTVNLNDTSFFKNLITSVDRTYTGGPTPVPSGKEVYYYSNIYTNTSDLKVEKLEMYPNPAGDYVNLKLKDGLSDVWVCIYNIQGELILKENYSNSSTISLQAFDKGIYSVQIFSEDELIYVGRLIHQ